ncbi:hypothetical protein N7517_003284 [Penicillium concentricum]|uniref:Uncharacterized protein n=1 Tax=Penicillium concentricum TaxID=293559 RepID=A0A9W9VKA7_9EURO|nr:uncharacterized protein N7517_003284 [Penicillium concentricum]KAJ5385373.1 hypothetical protein N7517_003284 [Penicillium concentricum]
MVLDWSALAPGPAGTAMLGERGIEAAARRGRERIRREQAEQREAEKKLQNGDDTASEVTLLPRNQSKELESKPERSKGGGDTPRSSMVSDADTLIERSDGRRKRGSIKGKLSRFKKQLMG